MDGTSSPPREGLASDGRPLKPRIQIFLGEFRILVPALGALFGFQLTSAFSSGWNELQDWEKLLNLGATACTAIAIGFLLLPANYHRVLMRVEEDEDFLNFAQRSFGLAFIFVALGMVGSLLLQIRRVTDDPVVFGVMGVGFFVFFLVMWGIVPKVRAKRHEEHARGDTKRTRRRPEAGGG